MGSADMIGWILLAYTFVPTVLAPMHEQNFAVLCNLYIFGIVAHAWPLKGGGLIAEKTRAYWPLLVMVLTLLSMPDMIGRCDMFPPRIWWERLRHSLGQLSRHVR